MYPIEEIQFIKTKAKNLNLIDHELLLKFSGIELQKICNGIGAEWFPKKLRKTIDKINPSFCVTAFIHDLHFHLQIGFAQANAIMLANGIIEAKATYKWYNPLRYIALLRVHAFYNACATGGIVAYNQIKEGGNK